MIIVDQITMAADEVEGWLARWRSDYVPGAVARGLELVGIWGGGGRDPHRSTVLIQWRVASVGTFWAYRQSATADPSVASFWSSTDAIAVDRDRRVLQELELA